MDDKNNVPVLSIISLGGNDYNHQNNDVPSQEEFSRGMEKFLDEKIGLNGHNVTNKRVLLICGMGWPQEVNSISFLTSMSELIQE